VNRFILLPACAAALAGILSLLWPGRAPAAQDICPAAGPPVLLSLPHLSAATAAGTELVIVAMGSSSTKGTGASDPAHSYPAVLERRLGQALPEEQVAVINRGIGGQDAVRELARLDTDAVAVRPQLVIWQAGANAALRGDDPAAFHRMMLEGVRRLLASGVDVVLMDNQRSPRLVASGRSEAMNKMLARVASETGVGLFSRDTLMADWPAEGFVAHDGLHMNDRGYRCTARALAHDIVASLRAASGVARR
jgi:lysophospholipase L1-like esterase